MRNPIADFHRGLMFALLVTAGATQARQILENPTPENVRAALDAELVEGVRIDSVKLSDDEEVRVRVEGNSVRNERLSAFMRRLETSETFHRTELLMIVVDPKGGYRFELDCRLRKPPPLPPPPPRKAHRCMIDGREIFQATPCPGT